MQKIIIYNLLMTKNVAAFFIWANTINSSGYAIILFQSSKNLLLYLALQNLLILTAKSTHTVSKMTFPQFDNIACDGVESDRKQGISNDPLIN